MKHRKSLFFIARFNSGLKGSKGERLFLESMDETYALLLSKIDYPPVEIIAPSEQSNI